MKKKEPGLNCLTVQDFLLVLGNLSSHSDLLPGMGKTCRRQDFFSLLHKHFYTRTFNQCTRRHLPFPNSQESVKAIALLPPYIIICLWAFFTVLVFLPSLLHPFLSVLSCLFHALHTSQLIASCSLSTHKHTVHTDVFSPAHSPLPQPLSMILYLCCEPAPSLFSTHRSPLSLIWFLILN